MKVEHRKTLRRVLSKPAPPDVDWADIESLLESVGIQVQNHRGDRLALVKGGEVMVVHRPKPKPLAVRATVADIATFLTAVGVSP